MMVSFGSEDSREPANSIVLVGLNHRTAPLALRERLSLADCSLGMSLHELTAAEALRPVCASPLREVVILSTCNRLEVYALAGSSASAWPAIEQFLLGLQNTPPEQLRPHLYFKTSLEAVEHLMRVAAGLDSMVLGEPQILGQVARAFAEAQAAAAAGPVLSHLFGQAVHAGKRARAETEIGRYTTSLSHAAALKVNEQMGDLSQARLLVIGAGEMARLAAQAMRSHGVASVTFINRTYSRAQRLADEFGGQALGWFHLAEALAGVDVVISATGAPHLVIRRDDVAQAMAQRPGRPLLLVDLAVPRDVEESAGELPGAHRIDIDGLRNTVDANLAQRQAAIPQVEAIVAQEAAGFASWLDSREVVPVLVDLRRKVQRVAGLELERTLRRLPEGHDPRMDDAVAELTHRIVNKLLHEPTVRLKALAAGGDGVAYAGALRELFALDGDAGWDEGAMDDDRH